MALKFKLAGFDKTSDKLTTEHEIPAHLVSRALSIANPENIPSDKLGDIPLSPQRAEELAKLLGKNLDLRGKQFFLEVSATPATRVRARA